jgi:hypothetical protein
MTRETLRQRCCTRAPLLRVARTIFGSIETVLIAIALLLIPAFAPAHEFGYPPVQRQRPPIDGRAAKPTALAENVQGMPRLEFGSGCRAAAAGNAASLNRCMSEEDRAREKLAPEWATFAHADRTQSTELTRLGAGMQSYVELITCLETARDPRALPKD